MKFYDLETKFTFGKFKGGKKKEIIKIQPSYLDWCAINLDHFYIGGETIKEIKSIVPSFFISKTGRNKLLDKHQEWEQRQERWQKQRNNIDWWDDIDWEKATASVVDTDLFYL